MVVPCTMDNGFFAVSDKYEDYVDQQRRQYEKSKPIKDWRKQFKNGRSNKTLLDMVPEPAIVDVSMALDIGAGEGYHTEDLMLMGYKAYGIELLEKRVRDAHSLGRSYIEQGDAHKLPWGDGMFDLVFMHEVLEHCAYPAKALGEIHRVLKSGKPFVISLPLEGHWKKPQAGIEDHNLGNRDTHVWKPTAAMLWTALEEAGFSSFKISLYELDTIRFRQEYQKGDPVGSFRPHAFVEGTK